MTIADEQDLDAVRPRPREDGEDFEELVPFEQETETIIVTATPGQLAFNTILPYPLRNSDKWLAAELNKKQLSELILACHREAGVGATIKLLDDIKDMGFKWATRYGLSVAITDMDPPVRREEIIREAPKAKVQALPVGEPPPAVRRPR